MTSRCLVCGEIGVIHIDCKKESTKDTSCSGATRNSIEKYRHDLIVWEFIDEIAKVLKEGVDSHGANNWKQGFDDNGKDIWNHIYNHQRRWREGDTSEPHLAKMAVGLMFQWYFDQKADSDAEWEAVLNSGNERTKP